MAVGFSSKSDRDPDSIAQCEEESIHCPRDDVDDRRPLRLLPRAPLDSLYGMVLPHKISTLLYCFGADDEVLLLERAKEPNLGLWSPCGGKLETATGESPYHCACREAREEMGLSLTPADLHLTGIISEEGYAGQAHWLMFLFEVKPRLRRCPPPISEGRFQFFHREALPGLPLPQTDREQIWPLFWQHRGGFFAAHCRCLSAGRDEWNLEEAIPAPVAATTARR